jgi:hypothetical protein
MAADEGDGKGLHFQDAVEDAWEDVKKKPGSTPGEYEVKQIVVVTENPITEYRVKIKKV